MPKSSRREDDPELVFWKNLLWQPPLYGADMKGSLLSGKKNA
jgi:hypothetical protein